MQQISLIVLFFGALKPIFGNKRTITISVGCSISDVLGIFIQENALSTGVLQSCQTAIDSEIKDRNYKIVSDCELAILPPFSGG